LLVTFVGNCNLNRPTDLHTEFESSQKDKSIPVGRFLESFYSKSRDFDCWCSEAYFSRADAGCL